jgi:hypothetical protein
VAPERGSDRSVNLVLLVVLAVLDGTSRGFGTVFTTEYALLPLLFVLVAAHGAYFGGRLGRLVEAEREAQDTEET